MPPAERCLWCGSPLASGRTVSELMFVEDELCGKCRSLLTPISSHVILEDLAVRGLYVYDEAFMKMLVQYKECMDEALQAIFLKPWQDSLRRRYRRATLIPMPSSRSKREKRGFDTIPQLFSGLRLPIVPLLEKTDDFEQQGNAKQRQSAADHIRLIPGVSIPSDQLVLIDDVLTTGSTLRAAQALLPQTREALVLAVNQRFLPSDSSCAFPSFFKKARNKAKEKI